MSTVAVPSQPPTASEDAESLRKALQGNCTPSRGHRLDFTSIASFVSCQFRFRFLHRNRN
jgi:hypothetical protein